jgi:hypothetical protein
MAKADPVRAPVNIQEVSDEALQAEVKRRRQVRADIHNNWLSRHLDLVLVNIDLLLEFTPDHCRTSCSDENPCNSGKIRCKRCRLLKLKNEDWNDCTVVNLSLGEDHPLEIE